jgi:long-chain acyl-CoA synthetase
VIVDLQTPSTLAPTFFEHARACPDKLAIWSEARSLSYRELADLVLRWSHALRRVGVKCGEHVAVILPNCVEFVVLFFVAADLGVTLVPLNTSLMPNAVQKACTAGHVKHLITNQRLAAPLLEARIHGGFGQLQGLWFCIDAETPSQGMLSLPALADGSPEDLLPHHAGRLSDALILTMTSGSTGDPKPIVLTQSTKLQRAHAAAELYSVSAEDRVLAATPLYHSLAERLVLLPLLKGATSILMAGFSASAWLECVASQRVSFSIAVSSQLKQIAAELAKTPTLDVSSLRCIVSSSALLDVEVKADLLHRLRCDFHECYGTSEIAIASNLSSEQAKTKLQSVGTAAPHVDIKILGNDDQILPVGEVGEIVCKTPMLFGGYYQRPDLTAAAMWGDYFRTGDLGKLDEYGFLTFMGRAKDLIISGGINVYPHDIESVVASNPAVRECAAFAYPDARLGEVVALALVIDATRFDLRQLRFYCAEQLADFQMPRQFFIVDSLPRNSMGKLMKHQLVTMFRPQE